MVRLSAIPLALTRTTARFGPFDLKGTFKMTNSTPCAARRIGVPCMKLDCQSEYRCQSKLMEFPYVTPEEVNAEIIEQCRVIGERIVQRFNMPPTSYDRGDEREHMYKRKAATFPEQLYSFYSKMPGYIMHGGLEKRLDFLILWTDWTLAQTDEACDPDAAFEGEIDQIPDAAARVAQWYTSNIAVFSPYPRRAGISKRERWSVIATLLFAWEKLTSDPAYEGDGYFDHFDNDGYMIRR